MNRKSIGNREQEKPRVSSYLQKLILESGIVTKDRLYLNGQEVLLLATLRPTAAVVPIFIASSGTHLFVHTAPQVFGDDEDGAVRLLLENVNACARGAIVDIKKATYVVVSGTKRPTPITVREAFETVLNVANDLQEYLSFFQFNPHLRLEPELAVRGFLAFAQDQMAGPEAAIDAAALDLASRKA